MMGTDPEALGLDSGAQVILHDYFAVSSNGGEEWCYERREENPVPDQ